MQHDRNCLEVRILMFWLTESGGLGQVGVRGYDPATGQQAIQEAKSPLRAYDPVY